MALKWGGWALSPSADRPAVAWHPKKLSSLGFCGLLGLLDGAGSLARRVTGNQCGEGVWGSRLDGWQNPKAPGKESGAG